MVKITRNELIKSLDETKTTTLVTLNDYLFYVEYIPNKKKIYNNVHKYDNFLFSMPSHLNNELNKKDITDINFQSVNKVLDKVINGKLISKNKITGEQIVEYLKPYTQEDFIRIHYLKHNSNKNIILYGPNEDQNIILSKYKEMAQKESANVIDDVNKFTTELIVSNLYEKLKDVEPKKTLIDTNSLVFKKYISS